MVKAEGKPNDLIERVLADPAFPVSREEIEENLRPEAFIGRSALQVKAFLAEVIRPLLDANRDVLGERQELNV